MNNNVMSFPSQGTKALEDFFGPTLNPSWHRVIIEGKLIPQMLVRDCGGNVEVLFDDRWVYIFDTKEMALMACSLAANAMAVGSGYSFLCAENRDMPFAPTVMTLDR